MADRYKYATAVHLYKPMIKRGVVDFAVSADWTPAAGDVKISIDGGAAANVTNLPTAITMGNTAMWDYSLTTGELTGKKIRITVADSATKAVEDVMFEIDTFGHASAQEVVDYTDGTRMALAALPNAAAEAAGGLYTRGSGAGQVNQQANGQLDVNLARWLNTAPVTPNTAGVPVVDDRLVVRQGTAQSGTSSTIVLDSGASSVDSFYLPCLVGIVGGTGLGQTPRVGTVYVGSSRTLTVSPAWVTNPASDTIFQLIPAAVSLEAWLRTAPLALVSQMVQAKSDLVTWLGTAPLALTSQKVQVSTVDVQTGGIVAGSFATDSITATALAASAANEIRDAVGADVIESNNSVTRNKAERIMYSVLAGVTASGGAVIKDPTGTTTRLTATIDGSNNRTAMTPDLS